jgi:hypothetical protein
MEIWTLWLLGKNNSEFEELKCHNEKFKISLVYGTHNQGSAVSSIHICVTVGEGGVEGWGGSSTCNAYCIELLEMDTFLN